MQPKSTRTQEWLVFSLEEILIWESFAHNLVLIIALSFWLIAAYLTDGVLTWFLVVHLMNWHLNKI